MKSDTKVKKVGRPPEGKGDRKAALLRLDKGNDIKLSILAHQKGISRSDLINQLISPIDEVGKTISFEDLVYCPSDYKALNIWAYQGFDLNKSPFLFFSFLMGSKGPDYLRYASSTKRHLFFANEFCSNFLSGGKRNSFITAVYFIIVDEEIVYIGITCNVKKRMQSHRVNDSWWPEGYILKFMYLFDDNGLAATIERKLIEFYRPVYNVKYNEDYTTRD